VKDSLLLWIDVEIINR